MFKRLYLFFCYFGLHRYEIVDVKFGFGAAGSTETIKCKDCEIQKVRKKD